MSRTPTSTRRIIRGFELDGELDRALERRAQLDDRSVSATIRTLLRSALGTEPHPQERRGEDR